MKIALVWNHPSRLLDCSFRFEQYITGFRALGHQPVVVCHGASAAGFDGPLEVVDRIECFEEPEFWRSVGAQVAVVVTWHRMAPVLAAIRAAGSRVVSIADTDGQIGLRVYPWLTLQRMWVYETSWRGRWRCLKYWLKRYATDGFLGSSEDREFVASTRNSDAVMLGNSQAKLKFRKFLSRQGEADLDRRVFVVPFTIGESLLSCPVPALKEDRIVAIGRWDDPQKHTALLVAAVKRFLDRGTATEVVICGRGGESWFTAPAGRNPKLRYVGVQNQEAVARLLSTARAIVFSSRWEGSPHAGLEALALGATLVGTPIPSLQSWTDGGRFGTVARTRRPRDLARAMHQEMRAWDEGVRDPTEISRHWRARLAPDVVCGQMLAGLAEGPVSV